MPTASQSLLTKRSSPRVSIPGRSQTFPTELNESGPSVNKFTVQFPKVYLDQRHGQNLLRGEFGEYVADTSNVDRMVKEFIRTGDQRLEVPLEKSDRLSNVSWFNHQGYLSGGTNFKTPSKLSAKEFLPVRRKESVTFNRSQSDSYLEIQENGDRAGSRISDYVEAEDVFHSGKRHPSNLATPGGNLSHMEEENRDYVYFQLEPFSVETNESEEEHDDEWPNFENTDHLKSYDNQDKTATAKPSARKRKEGAVFRLRRIEVDDEENPFEMFVDDSDPENVQIYRMSKGNSLVQVKNAEIRQTTDGRNVLIKTPEVNIDGIAETVEETCIEFSKILPTSVMTGNYKESEIGVNDYEMSINATISANQTLGDGNQFKASSHKDMKTPKVFNDNERDGSLRSKNSPRTNILRDRKTGKNVLEAAPNKVLTDSLDAQKSQKSFLPSVSPNVTFAEGTKSGSPRPFYSIDKENKALYDSLGLRPPGSNRTTQKAGTAGNDDFNREVSGNMEMTFPEQPYVSHENSFLSAEATESGALSESNGLSRIQQLSVDKKLKYLEPPVYFYEHPEPKPLALGFEYTGTDVTHVKVLRAVMVILESIPDAKVTSLQFVARNVILGTMWVDNRWIIEMSTKQCITVLLGRGIFIDGEQIKLRKLDDMIREDYTKFLQNKDKFNKKGKKAKHAPTQVNAMNLLPSSNDTAVNSLLDEHFETREQSVF